MNTIKYKCTANGDILTHDEALASYGETDQETKDHYGCFENWQVSNDCTLEKLEKE